MLKKLNMAKIMKEAHRMTKELKAKYPEIDYNFQLGLCISYLIEEYQEMDINDFMEDYKQNYKAYEYILFRNNILSKNGKISKDQELEAKLTKAYYNILYNHTDDIRQLALLKTIKYFDRHKVIKSKNRFALYGLMCLNAVKEYSRHLRRFNSFSDDRYLNIGWCGDVLSPIHNDKHSDIDFNIDIGNMFNDTQSKIIRLLKAGFTKVEIADLLGVSRQAVYKNINRIQAKLKEYYQYL